MFSIDSETGSITTTGDVQFSSSGLITLVVLATDHSLNPMSASTTVQYRLIYIIIDNRGLNARWCLTPFLPTAAYLGQRGLTPAGLSHTTAQCHLTILGEAVLFCLNHPSFRTPGSFIFCLTNSSSYVVKAVSRQSRLTYFTTGLIHTAPAYCTSCRCRRDSTITARMFSISSSV